MVKLAGLIKLIWLMVMTLDRAVMLIVSWCVHVFGT